MALQSGQGCLPSKVRDTAWLTEPQLKFSASIVVQATDCSKAQCAPVVATSVTIIAILAKRANTVILKLNVPVRMSSRMANAHASLRGSILPDVSSNNTLWKRKTKKNMKWRTIQRNNGPMRTTRLLRLSILASLLISFGIGPAANAQTAQTNSLAEGNTAFALDLYARLSGAPGNLFFSPYSISTCLAMTYAGARGETEIQMGRVLRFSQGGARVHSAFSELQQQLSDAEKPNGIQLEIANALWTQKGEPFLPAFLTIAKDDYQADIKQADFTTDADAVRREINGWVAQKTKEKIQDILPPDSVDAFTRLVVANAIYLKGAWATSFEKAATSTQPFHLSTNTQANAFLMRQVDNVSYISNDDFQAVELPYIGDDLSMMILLPRQIDALGQLEKQLSPAFLDRLLTQMIKQPVRIELPRFKLEARVKLNETLVKMGMPDAFIPGKADFSGINGMRRDLYISDVFHKAWVEVTEEGTEAAAATVVAMEKGARIANPLPPPVFRADHPFIFLIRDRVSGILLFVGRVADPRL
jgi:serine protease inhibitor